MRLTLEGLEDVKAGRTVEHASVHIWSQTVVTSRCRRLGMPR
jgi:predicted transcriptional regulator